MPGLLFHWSINHTMSSRNMHGESNPLADLFALVVVIAAVALIAYSYGSQSGKTPPVSELAKYGKAHGIDALSAMNTQFFFKDNLVVQFHYDSEGAGVLSYSGGSVETCIDIMRDLGADGFKLRAPGESQYDVFLNDEAR